MRFGRGSSSAARRDSTPDTLRAPGAPPFPGWCRTILAHCGLTPGPMHLASVISAAVMLPKISRPAQLRLTDCPPAVELLLVTPLCFRSGMLKIELAETLLRLNLKSTPGCWGLLPSGQHEGKWVVFRHLLLDGCSTTAQEFAAALRTAIHETELLYTRLPAHLRVGG